MKTSCIFAHIWDSKPFLDEIFCLFERFFANVSRREMMHQLGSDISCYGKERRGQKPMDPEAMMLMMDQDG